MGRKIHPVLLCGGSGSRLWPLSREGFPKQFLSLTDGRSLLQAAAKRGVEAAGPEPLIVIANTEHRFLVAEQLREIGVTDAQIVLEPAPRNTAAAVAAAALLAFRRDPSALILVMPADHHIEDPEAFRRAVGDGRTAADAGAMVLFGIRPTGPATGFGYVRVGAAVVGGAQRVVQFVEKPNRAGAEQFLASGDYYWNSGIFLLPADRLLEEFRHHVPAVLAAVERALDGSQRDLDFVRLDPAAFLESPSISIDYAIMERTPEAAMVVADFRWTDVGAWSSLWELGEPDVEQNVVVGDVVTEDTRGCYLRSEGPLVAVHGLKDLIVVATADAVLVAPRTADQDVRRLVDKLKAQGHPAATGNRRVYRPWGWYEPVDQGERFQVKRIMVRPKGKLSLQKHFHRAEHWVVVDGTALVSLDGSESFLTENESIYIPIGAIHRLSNPGDTPLHLVEVQTGTLLSEDDIVRLEDAYDRT